jgi:hypothetical protein
LIVSKISKGYFIDMNNGLLNLFNYFTVQKATFINFSIYSGNSLCSKYYILELELQRQKTFRPNSNSLITRENGKAFLTPNIYGFKLFENNQQITPRCKRGGGVGRNFSYPF